MKVEIFSPKPEPDIFDKHVTVQKLDLLRDILTNACFRCGGVGQIAVTWLGLSRAYLWCYGCNAEWAVDLDIDAKQVQTPLGASPCKATGV